ncbi:MinD/ParA family protein [Streptomyces sp. NPDC050560]|uniref:MinD/ParA family protein n=1 Tax=Streptomyces sp. NPDC050560 TaxID=3365630 RepID=UPI0037B143A8
MIEADSSGGDLMIRYGLPSTPSLLDVAAATGKPHPGSLLGAASELPCGVRAVASVPGRGPCREAVRLLAAEPGARVLTGEAQDHGTVLMDVGRLSDDVEPLLQAAERVVLVTRGGAEALTHVAAYGLDTEAYGGRLTLVVVGPCPYAANEIARSLSVEHVVLLPWDARGVSALSRGGDSGRRIAARRSASLPSASLQLAQSLAALRAGAGRSLPRQAVGLTGRMS